MKESESLSDMTLRLRGIDLFLIPSSSLVDSTIRRDRDETEHGGRLIDRRLNGDLVSWWLLVSSFNWSWRRRRNEWVFSDTELWIFIVSFLFLRRSWRVCCRLGALIQLLDLKGTRGECVNDLDLDLIQEWICFCGEIGIELAREIEDLSTISSGGSSEKLKDLVRFGREEEGEDNDDIGKDESCNNCEVDFLGNCGDFLCLCFGGNGGFGDRIDGDGGGGVGRFELKEVRVGNTVWNRKAKSGNSSEAYSEKVISRIFCDCCNGRIAKFGGNGNSGNWSEISEWCWRSGW